MTCKDKDCVL